MKGSVSPLVGSNPKLTAKFKMTCKPIKAGEELTAKYGLYDDFNDNN